MAKQTESFSLYTPSQVIALLREELAHALLRESNHYARQHPNEVVLLRQDYRGNIIFVAVRPVRRVPKPDKRRKSKALEKLAQSLDVVYDTKDCKGIMRNNRPYERAWAMLESMLWFGPVEITTEGLDDYLGKHENQAEEEL